MPNEDNEEVELLELPEFPEGTSAAVLQLRAGDLLVLMCPGKMRDSAIEYIENKLREFSPNVRCVVLNDGVTLGVLRPPDA